METRGNYILIGLFTIFGIVAAFVFFLAFASVDLDRDMSYYDIRFNRVSGLAEASDVRFAGLPVGQVVNVELSPDFDGTVTVRIEVDARTPVRTDSIATVESQGITGVGFVSISPGTQEADLQVAGPGEIGQIEAGRSVIQSLSEDAPALVSETLEVVRSLGEVFSGENRDRIEQIIINAEEASAAFADALEDFSSVTSSVDDFVTQIDRFNTVIQTIAADFDTVLITADQTITAWGEVAADVEVFLETGETTLGSADGTLNAAESYIREDLVATTEALRETITSLRSEVEGISREARTMVATFGETGDLANDRLREVAVTLDTLDVLIANTEVAMASVATAAGDFSTLVTVDGALLVEETRAVVASTQAAVDAVRIEAEETLPAILDDVSSAAAQIETLANGISIDMSGTMDRMDGIFANANTALLQATDTFANADETLAAITRALAVGEGTLVAATGAFTSAEEAITEEIGTLIDDLADTLDGLDAAVAQVSADLPDISESLSDASQAAEQAFEGISAAVGAASPAVQEFAISGLPQYAEFAREARQLTESLDRLIRQIERDPARFFLGSDAPEFRR